MGFFSKFFKEPQVDLEKSSANAKKMRTLFNHVVTLEKRIGDEKMIVKAINKRYWNGWRKACCLFPPKAGSGMAYSMYARACSQSKQSLCTYPRCALRELAASCSCIRAALSFSAHWVK